MITPVVGSVLLIISGKDRLPHGSSYASLELAGLKKITISCITALVFVHPLRNWRLQFIKITRLKPIDQKSWFRNTDRKY
jgi:hypothetical protein